LIAAQICETPVVLISLLDKDRQWFKSKIGLDATETPRDLAFCAHAIQTPNQIFEVQNAYKNVRFFGNPLVTGETQVKFYASAPLVTEVGYAIGN
jgi:GAF domain-containing protein